MGSAAVICGDFFLPVFVMDEQESSCFLLLCVDLSSDPGRKNTECGKLGRRRRLIGFPFPPYVLEVSRFAAQIQL